MLDKISDIIRRRKLITDRKLRRAYADSVSFSKLLRTRYSDRIILSEAKGIRGVPVRHIFMMQILWYLKEKAGMNFLRLLEIGSFIGSSVLTWDEAIRIYFNNQGSILVIDPLRSYIDSDFYSKGGGGEVSNVGEMDYLFMGDFAYRLLNHNIQLCSCSAGVQHLRCNSSDILGLFREKMFDVVYIDGNHDYEYVKQDIQSARELVSEGGIICGDDLELQLHEIDIDYARDNKSVDFIEDPKTNVHYHPGVTLAVGEEFKQVPCWEGLWAVQKTGDKWSPISLKGAPVNIPSHFPADLKKEMQEMLPGIKQVCEGLAKD